MDKSPKVLILGLLPLFVVPVWAAGGTFRAWQPPFLWFSLLAWIFFFAQPATPWLPPRPRRMNKLLRDPALWCALLFLAYLIVQFLNSGRMRVPDFETNGWSYSPPRWPGFPWSVSRDESLEMIHWFTPVLTVFLILKHAWSAIPFRDFLNLVCLNGYLNALLSFVHLYLGWERMYNFQRFGKDVYGSFGYPNHGAIYFILLFALSLGLFLREVFSEASERHLPTLWLNVVWTPIFFIAASLSTSRSGILGPWLILLLTMGSLAVIAFPRLHPVQRIYGVLGGLLTIAFFVASFVLAAKPVHLRELKSATVHLNIFTEIEGRFFQIESAFRMWLDHPWFGVGGWGYRYFVAEYLPREQWRLLGKGKANVHNDLVQFLAEFGLVGFGLLAAVFLPMIWKALRGGCRKPTRDDSLWAQPLRIGCFWGLFILLLISQFDIPLRSPAVFIHGVLFLVLLGEHHDLTSVWLPVVNWSRLRPPAFQIKGRWRPPHPEPDPDAS